VFLASTSLCGDEMSLWPRWYNYSIVHTVRASDKELTEGGHRAPPCRATQNNAIPSSFACEVTPLPSDHPDVVGRAADMRRQKCPCEIFSLRKRTEQVGPSHYVVCRVGSSRSAAAPEAEVELILRASRITSW
jgi:hypothetical protein